MYRAVEYSVKRKNHPIGLQGHQHLECSGGDNMGFGSVGRISPIPVFLSYTVAYNKIIVDKTENMAKSVSLE
jgi:hypothetical protein